jgi:predicted GNAT family acetyltransferase
VSVEHFTEAGEFLAQAESLLLADEARHNLLLGIAGTIRDTPDHYPERHMWLVLDGGRPAAAALRTPPYNLILGRPESDAALAELADAVSGQDRPGLVGASPEAEAFAKLWAARTSATAELGMRMGCYAIEKVEPLPPAPGEARVATTADRELVLRWWIEFVDDVHRGSGPARDRAEESVDHKIASPDGGFLLWEDEGQVVSFAGWGGPTPNGIRVGPVYTPPELRGHGYATTLTAELSRRQLAGGRRFCFLYTDLANPTSNAIYERIGYRRVCESAEFSFTQSPASNAI